MAWFGKIALGSLGMMFGGPLGAVLGAAVGHHLIDKQQAAAQARFQQASGAPFGRVAQHQAAGFVCILSMLAKIAKADGAVTQDELAVVDHFINSLPMPEDEKAFARRVFNEAKNSPHSLEDFAAQFYQMTRAEPTVLCSFLDVLFQVAAADGVLHPAEEKAKGVATYWRDSGRRLLPPPPPKKWLPGCAGVRVPGRHFPARAPL